jgi:hypothetical protein
VINGSIGSAFRDVLRASLDEVGISLLRNEGNPT